MPPSATKKRIEYIDLLRGWAVIVMIQTHMFNATLRPEITAGGFFQILKFIDGLVAPSFLFASGLAYAFTTRRKINDYLTFGPPLFRQFARLFFVLGIGYALHLPKFNYNHLLHDADHEAWMVFFQVDVLHCIAVSLLFLQVLLLILRSERRLYLVLSVVVAGVVFATPVMWGIDFRTLLPAPLAAYFNGLHYSLFPLFPWSAFLFAGSITGYGYVEARQKQKEKAELKMMNGAALGGLALIVASFALEPPAQAVYPVYDYWLFSPSFVLLRIGLVLTLCSVMFRYEKLRGVSPRSVVTLVGRESLIVYATHLMVIYGKLGPRTFQEVVGNSFGYVEAIVATGILLGAMILLALIWSRIKQGPPRLKIAAELGTLAAFLGVFFFWPS
jgi:uncharacterized membrane protein